MQVITALLISTLAGLSTILGGLVIFFKFKETNVSKFITASLAFSLAIMIGISITDLIPESTYIILNNYGITKGIFYCLIMFLIGIILIKYLNKLITKSENNKNDLYKLKLKEIRGINLVLLSLRGTIQMLLF